MYWSYDREILKKVALINVSWCQNSCKINKRSLEYVKNFEDSNYSCKRLNKRETVLIIEAVLMIIVFLKLPLYWSYNGDIFKKFPNSTYDRDSTYNRDLRVLLKIVGKF